MANKRQRKKAWTKSMRLMLENKRIQAHEEKACGLTEEERVARLAKKRGDYNHVTKVVATYKNPLLKYMN